MGIDELRNTILNTSFSISDVQRRIRFLQGFLESQFFSTNTIDLKTYLQSNNATQSDVEIMISWGAVFYQAFTKSNLYELIKQLTDSIHNISQIVLYLPYTPDDQGRNIVGQTMRQLLGKPIILDIRYDSSLGAGCAFSIGGIYKDYSLRTMLSEKRNVINQIVTKYATTNR